MGGCNPCVSGETGAGATNDGCRRYEEVSIIYQWVDHRTSHPYHFPSDISHLRCTNKTIHTSPPSLPPSPSIADINQSLCDDGLVDKDKIGGSNYYWSFPAKKDRLLQLEHEGTLTKIEALRTSVKDAEARLADAKRGREEEEGEGGESSSSSRASKMARRSELLAEINAANIELEKLRQNDPKEIANLEKELDLVRGAAHRWTDNIFSCKDYLVKKRGMMKAEGERVRQCRFL